MQIREPWTAEWADGMMGMQPARGGRGLQKSQDGRSKRASKRERGEAWESGRKRQKQREAMDGETGRRLLYTLLLRQTTVDYNSPTGAASDQPALLFGSA